MTKVLLSEMPSGVFLEEVPRCNKEHEGDAAAGVSYAPAAPMLKTDRR
jgi:hypothetical protein